MLPFGVGCVQVFQPFVQRRDYFTCRSLLKFPPRELTGAALVRFQEAQKCFYGFALGSRLFQERPVGMRDAPDAPTPMIPTGVPFGKVHIFKNLRVKIGDVQGAIRPQCHGHGSKKRIVASQQMSVGFDLIDGPVRFQGVPGGASFPDAMIDEEAALNSGRKVRAEQKLAARCDVSAGVEGEVIGSMLGLGISEVRGKYIHRIILPGRGVEHDATSPAVEQVAERVPKTVRHVDPEPVSLRPVTKHRRVTHAARPVRRLALCVVKNTLREIQCPTRTPPEIVHRVFRILSTKAMKQHLHPV